MITREYLTSGMIAEFEKAHPEFYWHIAKGRITAGEPLYGAIITTERGIEIGHGESNVSAEDAFRIAIESATKLIRAALTQPLHTKNTPTPTRKG